MMSISRMISASSHFGEKPARRPKRMPPDAATTTTTMPTKNEYRAPFKSRESMSRPSGSVPSGKLQLPPSCQTGGISANSRNCWVGSCGAIHGAVAATITKATKIQNPNTAPRFSRK